MFARSIYIFLAIAAFGILAYAHWYQVENIAIYALIPLIPAVIIFIMSPQINWWFYGKNPQTIDPELRKMLEYKVPFYQALNIDDKERFEKRINLFFMAKDFQPMQLDEVGEDIKAAVGISAVQLTFHKKEDWLFDAYEKVLIYSGPFPTPQYEEWHITEHFEEDGVMIFSAQHLMHGFFEPRQYLNTALYEFANVYQEKYLNDEELTLGEHSWADLEKISGFTEEKMKAYVGLQSLNPVAAGISFYFTHRDRFLQYLPEEFARLQRHFG